MININSVDLLLINPPFHRRNGSGSFFPLGLGYIISSVSAQGYTWSIIDCTKIIDSFYEEDLKNFEERLLLELQTHSPRLIGIGPCITTQLRALKVISNCCKLVYPSIPLIAGGPLASIDGQEWLFYENLGIDHIVKGDGEQAIPDAIEKLVKTKKIADSSLVSRKGYTHNNVIGNLDLIRFPYRGLSDGDSFSIRRSSNMLQNQAAMIASRGCPYSCKYCVSGNLQSGSRVRRRSVDNIVCEMEELNRDHGINDIVFYDDCFFGSAKTAEADIRSFCNALEARGLNISWQIEMRPDLLLALGDESIKCLDNAGCRQMNIGIEKVTESGLRFLGKGGTISGAKEKVSRIKEISKMELSATFILGGGDETHDDVLNLIRESTDFGLDFAHYNPLFVYPGTPLYAEMFEDPCMWVDTVLNDECPWGEIVFENNHLKCTDLLELVDYAYSEFYRNSTYYKQEMVIDRFNIKSRVIK